MEEGQNFYQQKQKFNIAVPSQMEISDILKRMSLLDTVYPIDSPEKQKIKLNLVIFYLIRATPYLSIQDSQKYKEELLSFGIRKNANVKRGTQKLSYQFDSKLDYRLNEILIELQQRLRHIFSKIRDEEEEGL